MRITSESDYALRIITSLAEYGEIVDAKTLSAKTLVTQRFALKILHKLVKCGLVLSFKGVKGGYKLALSPEKISLRRVIEEIDGPIAIARCLESSESCSLNCDKTACIYHHIFDTVSLDLAKRLDNITIKDVLSGTYTLS